MMNTVLRGKPDAGNPHVAPTRDYGGTSRFDEGEVAPAKPMSGSLLYKSINMISFVKRQQLVFVLSFFSLTSFAADWVVVELGPRGASAWPVRESAVAPGEEQAESCRTKELWLRRIPGSDELAGVFEVTQDQYRRVTGEDPSRHKGGTRPVECVSWHDAREKFCAVLTKKTEFTFDLPTEAMWKKACLANSKNGNFGNPCNPKTINDHCMDGFARYTGNRRDGRGGGFIEHVIVGSYAPNGWGLYDCHGNVAEMCLDPHKAKDGALCLKMKGGCWYPAYEVAGAWQCSAQHLWMSQYMRADSDYRSDIVGFRTFARVKKEGGAK